VSGARGPVTEIVRGDASRIEELEPLWLALREYHGSVTPDWGALRPEAESWERRRTVYADILEEGGVLFMADQDSELVGFALCEQEQGGSPTWEWPEEFLSIVDLVVLPANRGQGLGDALLDAVEAEARERGVAALDVNAAAPNELARRFYERHGYRLDLVTYRKPLR
jgi:ribosomal protein S18 acetylase RimI-like enzyme